MSLNSPFWIDDVKIPNPVVLSPMEAVNDIAFRELCKRYGAGLVSTEMVAADALVRNIPAALELVKIHPEEHPVSTQLFGVDVDLLTQAAKMLETVESIKTDIVDLNVGCPAPRILAMGAGSALLKDLEQLRKICTSITDAITTPFTLKMRIGLSENHMTYKQMVDICNATGVAALKVHGRTTKQGYSGKSDWTIIKEIKEMASMPIIGNGDIFDPKFAQEMMEYSGVDAIMIGRGALGNPTIFKRVLQYFDTEEILPLPTKLEQIELYVEYLTLARKYNVKSNRFKAQGLYFLRGFDGASKMRGDLSACKSTEAMEEYLLGVCKESDGEKEIRS
jgi:tRNA-dihydrouridine synthase B